MSSETKAQLSEDMLKRLENPAWRFEKLVAASPGWYVRIYKKNQDEVKRSVFPVAVWAETKDIDNSVIGLFNHRERGRLVGPPPNYECDYVIERELTELDWLSFKNIL